MGRRAVQALLIPAGLVALVAGVYWQVGGFAFLEWDDGRYVVDNPVVRRGLTGDGLVWAFTTLHASNWHPLTWLSHMLDVALFGLDAGWHHRVNVLWHAANCVLLFVLLRSSTGSIWRSGLAAALFAVHPLNVESVAWIAERKNVLSTFLWLLTMTAYVRHARKPSAPGFIAIVAAFTAGLLAKPMVVTLPIVLLLWDFWPLGRIAPSALWPSLRPRLVDKMPLLSLSAIASAVTIAAQATGGTLSTTDAIPASARVANAALSYTAYLEKALWPTSLAAFYPRPALSPTGMPVGRVLWASVALLAVIVAVAVQWRRRPYLATGLLWYLITLLPVIGIIQVGRQGIADRYAYVPLIGIFIAVAWAVPAPPAEGRLRRRAVVAAAGLLLVVAAARAHGQAAVWRDTATLFAHVTAVIPDNWLAWKNVGVEHYRRERFALAIAAFRQSLRGRPDDPETWTNLAAAHGALDQHEAAAAALRAALRLRPDDQDALWNLAVAYAISNQPALSAHTVARLRELNTARADALSAIISRGRPPR